MLPSGFEHEFTSKKTLFHIIWPVVQWLLTKAFIVDFQWKARCNKIIEEDFTQIFFSFFIVEMKPDVKIRQLIKDYYIYFKYL